jgi:glycosyltransferase involved in cell wall biosynthesis
LSVLICSLESRRWQLRKLLAVLGHQIGDWEARNGAEGRAVEILWDVDAGQKTIGRKRQELLERSSGEYVCFVDDDDAISDDYVGSILKALEGKPDCVGFEAEFESLQTGRKLKAVFSNKYKYNTPLVGGMIYHGTCHLTPVKREIALRIGFKDTSFNEDVAFSEQVVKLCRTEAMIPKCLYHYRANHKF